jgi:hypothetical protein
MGTLELYRTDNWMEKTAVWIRQLYETDSKDGMEQAASKNRKRYGKESSIKQAAVRIKQQYEKEILMERPAVKKRKPHETGQRRGRERSIKGSGLKEKTS